MQYLYHFLYKTTCLVNNTFYIGIHSTNNLEDGYLGSGKRLGYSIAKYGKNSHTREILEFFKDRKSLALREKEIVCEEFIKNPMCMNITIGGIGANNIQNLITGRQIVERAKQNGTYDALVEQRRVQLKKNIEKYGHPWVGREHSLETKEKLKEVFKGIDHQQGEKNSQFGTCWIHNLQERDNKKIRSDELNHYLNNGWKKGRKVLFDESASQKKYREIKEKRDLVNSQKLEKQIKLYSDYFLIYNDLGFKKFCELTGYDKSLPNLVNQFKKYVKEYIPQNGKKRGIK